MTAMWKATRFGDALSRVERFEPRNDALEYTFAGTYSYARGIFEGDRKLGSTFKLPKVQRIKAGDFIYCKIMAWEGAFGLAPQEVDGCVMSGAFVAYEPRHDLIDPQFLDWYFRTPTNWRKIGRQSSGTNVRRQSLHPDQFESCQIMLPPLDEQRQIVARVMQLTEKLSDARNIREKAIEEMSVLTSSVARVKLANPDWPQAPLGELCVIITDGTHQTPRYVDEGAIFLSAQNVKPFRFIPKNHRKVSWEDFAVYTARNKPRKGDVLLTRVGAGIGEAVVVDQDIEFAIYVSIALIRTDTRRLLPEFLVHWLNSPYGMQQSRGQTLGRGHSQGNLNLNLLRGFLIPVPPLDEQRHITMELDALYSKVSTIGRMQSETASELDAMLPAILDKAFRGEL